jgi:hypothetical protein
MYAINPDAFNAIVEEEFINLISKLYNNISYGYTFYLFQK